MLCGCQTSAHMSKSQVARIARTVATDNGENLENYKSPTIEFFPDTGKWIASFSQKAPYTLGNPSTYHYFAVTVNDATGTGTYQAGKFK